MPLLHQLIPQRARVAPSFPRPPALPTWAMATDLCHGRAGSDSLRASGKWVEARAKFRKLLSSLFFHFCFWPPTIPTDTSRTLSVFPGLSQEFFWVASGIQAALSSLGHVQAWERGASGPEKPASCLLALTSHLAQSLASPGHPAQVWLQLNPVQPHPGFWWLHRPGFGLMTPLWASGPQRSLVSDFTSPLMDSSLHPRDLHIC